MIPWRELTQEAAQEYRVRGFPGRIALGAAHLSLAVLAVVWIATVADLLLEVVR